MAVPESKICNSVPQGFRGEGTFVLNCEHINRLDCNNDGLGAWGMTFSGRLLCLLAHLLLCWFRQACREESVLWPFDLWPFYENGWWQRKFAAGREVHMEMHDAEIWASDDSCCERRWKSLYQEGIFRLQFLNSADPAHAFHLYVVLENTTQMQRRISWSYFRCIQRFIHLSGTKWYHLLW